MKHEDIRLYVTVSSSVADGHIHTYPPSPLTFAPAFLRPLQTIRLVLIVQEAWCKSLALSRRVQAFDSHTLSRDGRLGADALVAGG